MKGGGLVSQHSHSAMMLRSSQPPTPRSEYHADLSFPEAYDLRAIDKLGPGSDTVAYSTRRRGSGFPLPADCPLRHARPHAGWIRLRVQAPHRLTFWRD